MSMTVYARLFLAAFFTLLIGCETATLATYEKFGYAKRDVLVDRIENAQEAQVEGQEQFKDALEEFKSVVNYDGGDLEKAYKRLNSEYEDSVDAADNIRNRIDKVESVARALFKEWKSELDEYTSANLRRDSEQQLRDTQRKFDSLLRTMRNAEATLEPVLAVLRDNTLYLKHNLNARAINSLKGEVRAIDNNVKNLIAAMDRSIQESNRFIAGMKQG